MEQPASPQLYVLQTDGSVLPALINAASLALVDAGVAMREPVAACSVALLDDQPVLVRACLYAGMPSSCRVVVFACRARTGSLPLTLPPPKPKPTTPTPTPNPNPTNRT